MNRLLFIVSIILTTYVAHAVTYYTSIRTGDFKTSTTWSGGQLPPIPSVGNAAYVTIGSGHTVTLNDNIIFGNSSTLEVIGILIINGDLTADYNSLDIRVEGQLIINGGMVGKNGANIMISGDVSVEDSVYFENNGTLTLNDGVLDIGGNLVGAIGCQLYGTGIINLDGTNNFDQDYPSTIIINGGLPVEFIRLSYKANPDNVELNWETASEIFNDYFTIEKSKNGITFEIIGTIQGTGYSNSIVKYNFYDDNVTAGICYYRLKQTDYDGTTVILKTIACKIAPDRNTLISFQNPIVDQTFQINYSGESGKYVLNIHNTNGQIILSKKNIFDNNSGTFNINRSGLKGYYFISITDPFGKISSYPVILN